MRRRAVCVALILTIGLSVSRSGLAQEHPDPTREKARADEQIGTSLGVLAYIYGYPLVRMEEMRQQSLSQGGQSNEFRHRRALTTPADRVVVSPNNDTAYSSSWLDLSSEPMVLLTPKTGGRYCSYAFYDAYTNNFKVISKRTARDEDAAYAITGPRWRGTLPKGVTRVEAPTNTVWLLVRTLIVDESDWPGVRALQEQMKLMGLRQWSNKSGAHVASSSAGEKRQVNRDPLAFFEQLGLLLRRNPPPPSDATLLDQFATIGLSSVRGFEVSGLSEGIKAGLTRAVPIARQILTATKGDESLHRINNWLVATKGGTFGTEFLFRAVIAAKGIGQLIPEEAAYLVTDLDRDGKPLNGANRYVLRFPKGQLPPATEFWSLTLYGADFFFVENALRRYAIGDRTRGLRFDDDGGVTIYIQHEAPTGKESNWLPAPMGDFNLNLRAYLPKPALLKEEWHAPAVERLQ